MKNNIVTIEELKYRIRAEGASYAILNYHGKDIKCGNEEVEKLWKQAHNSLVKLIRKLDSIDEFDIDNESEIFFLK